MSGCLVVIPARFGSTRFPGKALADLAGAPLVVRVAQRALQMKTANSVVVATDDMRILKAVTAAGLACEMTGEHPTGTDRVGEVARRHRADIVVNLQGDEPLLDPAAADSLVTAVASDDSSDLATLAHPLVDLQQWQDPHCVKVVVDRRGNALYFSRAAIPGAFPGAIPESAGLALRHIGIYAFRHEALLHFLSLPRSPLEQAEGLEQLRALEHGLRIKVCRVAEAPIGVDTPADLEKVRGLWPA